MNKIFYIIIGVSFTTLARFLMILATTSLFWNESFSSFNDAVAIGLGLVFYLSGFVCVGYINTLCVSKKGFSKVETYIHLLFVIGLYLIDTFIIRYDMNDLCKIEAITYFLFLQLGSFIYRKKARKAFL